MGRNIGHHFRATSPPAIANGRGAKPPHNELPKEQLFAVAVHGAVIEDIVVAVDV
jgi:hypothetical protein